MLHDWSIRHLCADTWRLLGHLRRLHHRREAEVVWVLGNHDRHLGHVVAALLGVETTETFRWTHAGRAFAAVHGDRFDGFVSKHVRVADFFSRSYAFAQRRLSTGGEWPKLLDRLHAGLSSLSEQVEEVPSATPPATASTSSSAATPTARAGRCSTSPARPAASSSTSTPAAG